MEAKSELNMLSPQTVLCHLVGRLCLHRLLCFLNPDVWNPVLPLESAGHATLSRPLPHVSKESCQTLTCLYQGKAEKTECWTYWGFLTHAQDLAMMNYPGDIDGSWVGAQDLIGTVPALEGLGGPMASAVATRMREVVEGCLSTCVFPLPSSKASWRQRIPGACGPMTEEPHVLGSQWVSSVGCDRVTEL